MNKQIAKLANQAGFDVDAAGKFGNYSEMSRVERFAESIIAECMGINHREYPAPGGVGEYLNRFIKEHFGVKQ